MMYLFENKTEKFIFVLVQNSYKLCKLLKLTRRNYHLILHLLQTTLLILPPPGKIDRIDLSLFLTIESFLVEKITACGFVRSGEGCDGIDAVFEI